MNRTALATLTGLILGLALLGSIGYCAAKALNGELDVAGWLSRNRSR